MVSLVCRLTPSGPEVTSCLTLFVLEVLHNQELELMMHAEVLARFDPLEYVLDVLEGPPGLPLLALSLKVVQVPVEVL